MEELAFVIVGFFILLLIFMRPAPKVFAQEGFDDRPKGICNHEWKLISSKRGEVRNYLTVLVYKCTKCGRRKKEIK